MKPTKLLYLIWALLILSACDETPLRQDAAPVISFADTLLQVYENEGTQNIALNLSAPAVRDLAVSVLVKAEINVREGENYTLSAREVRFAQGATTANLAFEVKDDRIANQPRSFELEIVNDNSIQKDPTKSVCHVDILDDESQTAVAFSDMLVTWREANHTYYLPVEVKGPATGDITIRVETIDSSAVEGKHYKMDTREFTITDPDFKGIPVTLIDDREVTPDRLFSLRISEVTGAMRITSKSISLVTIQNDDLGFTIGNTSNTIEERPDDSRTLKVPVQVIGNPLDDLHLEVAVVDGFGNAVEGQDFEIVNNGKATIPLGQNNVSIEIRPKYNSDITGDKNFRLKIRKVEDHEDTQLETAYCDIIINDYNTEVSFEQTTYKIGLNITSIDIPVQLSNPVQHDIKLRINGLTRAASDLEIENPNVTIPAGVADTTFKVYLSSNTPSAFTIGLSIVSGVEEKHLTTPSCDLHTLENKVIDKSDWTIDFFTSEEPSGEGPTNGHAVELIDGNDNSFWHSRWASGSDNGPFDIIIDLHKQTSISHIKCVKRINNGDTKRVSFHLSDGENKDVWTKLGEVSYPNATTNALEMDYIGAYIQGRYFKVTVEECRNNTVASLGEIYLEGLQ